MLNNLNLFKLMAKFINNFKNHIILLNYERN